MVAKRNNLYRAVSQVIAIFASKIYQLDYLKLSISSTLGIVFTLFLTVELVCVPKVLVNHETGTT